MDHDRTMTLHFNDGSKLSFDFPEQAPTLPRSRSSSPSS